MPESKRVVLRKKQTCRKCKGEMAEGEVAVKDRRDKPGHHKKPETPEARPEYIRGTLKKAEYYHETCPVQED